MNYILKVIPSERYITTIFSDESKDDFNESVFKVVEEDDMYVLYGYPVDEFEVVAAIPKYNIKMFKVNRKFPRGKIDLSTSNSNATLSD